MNGETQSCGDRESFSASPLFTLVVVDQVPPPSPEKFYPYLPLVLR